MSGEKAMTDLSGTAGMGLLGKRRLTAGYQKCTPPPAPLGNRIRLMLLCAIIYVLLDLPLRLTGAYGFPPGIGIKSFLPFTLGLFFGPYGACACALGTLAAGLAADTPTNAVQAEMLCALISGLCLWLAWYAPFRWKNDPVKGPGQVSLRFEKPGEFVYYVLLTGVLSAVSGALTALFPGSASFLAIFAGNWLMGLLIGLPVNIILSGIFCIEPVTPAYCRRVPDLTFRLSGKAHGDSESGGLQSLDEVNEAIEETARRKKIPMKRIFEIESCLEELYIRINRVQSEPVLEGTADFSAAISLRLRFVGLRYNPLRMDKNEDEMDVVSLKLIRHRALRASYSYSAGENLVHIVV